MGSAEIVSSPTTELKKISSSKLYYQLDADRVIETLETNAERGLTSDQCRKRHEENGPNMVRKSSMLSRGWTNLSFSLLRAIRYPYRKSF